MDKQTLGELKVKLTNTQKLDKLLVLINLLNMEMKGLRKLIIYNYKEMKNDKLSNKKTMENKTSC